eukprot:3444763-Pleurochrysis_carterae.AAC.2
MSWDALSQSWDMLPHPGGCKKGLLVKLHSRIWLDEQRAGGRRESGGRVRKLAPDTVLCWYGQ